MMTQTEHSTSTKKDIRRLAALAIPTFGQLIAEPVFVLIDTAIVGHLGASALAGLSLGSTVVLTAVGLCVFLAYATTSQVAHLFGAGQRREGMLAGVSSVWLALLIGAVLTAVLFACAEPICWALGGRADALDQAVIYTQMVVLGVPGMLIVYAANGMYRGLQKAGITLVVAVLGAVVNTMLALLFVLGFGWGVAGSGVATCIAQWFMGLALLVPVIRWAKKEHVSLMPRLASIAVSASDGWPLFLRTLALRVGMVATIVTIARLGTDALAGYQVVNATWNFAVNALDSVAIAGQALVGAQLGAADKEGARRMVRLTAKSGAVLGVLVGVVFVVLGFVAGGVFSPVPEVQHVALVGMVVMGIFMPLQGWMWALDGILIGAGDFRYLAKAVSVVAGVYLVVLAAVSFTVLPLMPHTLVSCGVLWVTFNMVFMGGRAIANGYRINRIELDS